MNSNLRIAKELVRIAKQLVTAKIPTNYYDESEFSGWGSLNENNVYDILVPIGEKAINGVTTGISEDVKDEIVSGCIMKNFFNNGMIQAPAKMIAANQNPTYAEFAKIVGGEFKHYASDYLRKLNHNVGSLVGTNSVSLNDTISDSDGNSVSFGDSFASDELDGAAIADQNEIKQIKQSFINDMADYLENSGQSKLADFLMAFFEILGECSANINSREFNEVLVQKCLHDNIARSRGQVSVLKSRTINELAKEFGERFKNMFANKNTRRYRLMRAAYKSIMSDLKSM